MKNRKKIIIGISGASGAIYAIRLIRALLKNDYSLDLIISDYGKYTLAEEMGFNIKKESVYDFCLRSWNDKDLKGNVRTHANDNLASPLASGNPDTLGMIVVPCTMKTLSAISSGHSAKLIERAADCVLKEKQKLILVPRETPLNLIHIRNMETVTLAGGVILPAMPGFYQKPKDFNDLGDFLASKIMNLLGIENYLYKMWGEEKNKIKD